MHEPPPNDEVPRGQEDAALAPVVSNGHVAELLVDHGEVPRGQEDATPAPGMKQRAR